MFILRRLEGQRERKNKLVQIGKPDRRRESENKIVHIVKIR